MGEELATNFQGSRPPPFRGYRVVPRDERGRFAMPTDHVRGFGGQTEGVIGPSPKHPGIIYIFQEQAFDAFIGQLERAMYAEKDDADAQASYDFYNTRFFPISIKGSAHRVSIPADMAKDAGLGSTVVVAGRGDRLLVMNEQRWEAWRSNIAAAVAENVNSRWR